MSPYALCPVATIRCDHHTSLSDGLTKVTADVAAVHWAELILFGYQTSVPTLCGHLCIFRFIYIYYYTCDQSKFRSQSKRLNVYPCWNILHVCVPLWVMLKVRVKLRDTSRHTFTLPPPYTDFPLSFIIGLMRSVTTSALRLL